MFRPSHESLLLQNAEVDRLNLPRIQDDTELEALKADGSLLEIRCGEIVAHRSATGSFPTLLPVLDARFRRRSEPGLLQPLSRADPGELGGTHGEGAEEAAAAQSQCGSVRKAIRLLRIWPA